jgi:hypothetical protein
MPQPLKVADRLGAQDLRHGQVDQQLTAVIDRVEAAAAHRRGHLCPQATAFGQQPHRQRPGEPDQTVIVVDKLQPVGP